MILKKRRFSAFFLFKILFSSLQKKRQKFFVKPLTKLFLFDIMTFLALKKCEQVFIFKDPIFSMDSMIKLRKNEGKTWRKRKNN